MLPPVMLAVSAVASRTTRTSRSVYEVIEVSSAVAEVVVDVEVAEHELVGERLLDLRELLAVAERHRRPRRRERIGEDVVGVDAVPAVRLDLLVDERGVIGQLVVRLKLNDAAHAGAVAVVDVLLDAQVRLHGVDEAAMRCSSRPRASRPCRRAGR